MTAVAPVAGYSAEVFEAFLTGRREPAWVTARRREAFEIYQDLLSQDLNPEEWRRVDLRALRPQKYAIAKEGAASNAALTTLLADRAEFGGSISHVDGRVVRSQLSEELAAKGVVFGSLSDLVETHGDLLKGHLHRAVPASTDRYAAWHAAFWTGGTVLYVPRNVEVKLPLYSLIGLASEGVADFSHTVVILEENATATLLEETASLAAGVSGLHVGAVELLLAPNSQLRYVQLQNWNDQVWHIAHQTGRIDRDAFLQWTVGGLGAKAAHIHQDVHLDGRGASAEVNGVSFATGRQVLSYYTQQNHNAPNTRSDLLYKDVIRDRARVIWRGMIKVAEAAQKTDGYQRNDCLILSDDARADAIPGLEIEADDVRCTHGATVGRVDEDQVLYCMSRGLSRYEAMHLIVEGFFRQVYDRIPVEVVQETLDQAVERKLGLDG